MSALLTYMRMVIMTYSYEDVNIILSKTNFNPNYVDKNKISILHLLTSVNMRQDNDDNVQYNIAKLLIEKYDANVNNKDLYGWTPLHNAVWHNKLDLLDLYIKHDGNVKLKTDLGQDCLELAYLRNNRNIIEYLIINNENNTSVPLK